MTYKMTDKWIQACAEGEPEDEYQQGVQQMARELLECRAKERIHQMTEVDAFITLGKLIAAEKVVEVARVVTSRSDLKYGMTEAECHLTDALEAYDKVVKGE